MSYLKLRRNIIVIILGVVLLLLSILHIYNFYDRRELLYNTSIEKLLMMTKMIRKIEKQQFRLYKGRVHNLQNDESFTKLITSKDTTNLALFMEQLKQNYLHLTPALQHLHLYDTNKKLIIDLDTIDENRFHEISSESLLLVQSAKTHHPIQGYIQANETHFYTTFVFPIYHQQQIIAYISFGINPDDTYKIASKAGRYRYALLLHNHLVSNNDKQLFEKFNITQKFLMQYANKNKLLHLHDRYYIFQQYDISSHIQPNFAQVVFAKDVTNYVQEMLHTLLLAILFSASLLGISLVIVYILIGRLIKKLIQDEHELAFKQQQLQMITDSSDNLITLFEDGQLIMANTTFLHFFEFKNLEAFQSQSAPLYTLFQDETKLLNPEMLTTDKEWVAHIHALQTHYVVSCTSHKKTHYFEIQTNHISSKKESYSVIFVEITDMYKKSQHNQYMAHHDQLTGIYNRQSFNEMILELMKTDTALLLFDLDFFKKVNDTYGHQVGDEVLKTFVKRISSKIRKGDIFARWGGEEFVLVLQSTPHKRVMQIAEELRGTIEATPFETAGTITCSIGVSFYQDGEGHTQWFERVDEALYKAKENGRNRVEIL